MTFLHLLAHFIYFFPGRREESGGCVEVGEGLKIRVALAHKSRAERHLVQNDSALLELAEERA